MNDKRLEFGYNRGLPEAISAAWGARTIWQDGQVGLLGDRVSTFGPPEEVLKIAAQLEGGAFVVAREQALHLYETGELTPRDDREVVLFSDAGLIIKGNPQRSYGYLYMVAFLQGGRDDA